MGLDALVCPFSVLTGSVGVAYLAVPGLFRKADVGPLDLLLLFVAWLYKLMCVPSMKANPYHVELVFVQDETPEFHLHMPLCFCLCKRGCIGS